MNAIWAAAGVALAKLLREELASDHRDDLPDADLMGRPGELGLVKEGQLADLLLVDGDPLADIDILQDTNRLLAIMKDGVFHKEPPRRVSTLSQAAE